MNKHPSEDGWIVTWMKTELEEEEGKCDTSSIEVKQELTVDIEPNTSCDTNIILQKSMVKGSGNDIRLNNVRV